jgi:hypothetical protein
MIVNPPTETFYRRGRQIGGTWDKGAVKSAGRVGIEKDTVTALKAGWLHRDFPQLKKILHFFNGCYFGFFRATPVSYAALTTALATSFATLSSKTLGII